jgi:putative flippase GtrA
MSIVIYFFVGGFSFLANFFVFIVLVKFLGLHWVAANVAGFVAGTLMNYVLSIRFVFESRIFSRRHHEVFLTTIVSILGVAIETLLIHFGQEILNLTLVLAKVGAAGIVFFWNYWARRYLIFGSVKGDGPV